MHNRNDFVDSFFSEMPENLGNIELFDMIEYNIKERSKRSSVSDLGSGYKKI